MKKTLFLSALLFSFMGVNAAELPEPSIRVLPQEFGYFDAFVVSWAQDPTSPYSLEIVDETGISVTKNLVEDLYVYVGLTEYQEDENSQNYPDSRLIITLSSFETQIGSYYTLMIPEGAINVIVGPDEYYPNEKVEYTFQLRADENEVTLPEPEIQPQPGNISEISVIKMSWTGKLGTLDLLNVVNEIDPTAGIAPITLTIDGEQGPEPEISFEWSSRAAVTEGSRGDILVLTLGDETSLPDGEYIINIPAGFLQITDIETGTLYNDEIILNYVVKSEGTDAIDSINNDQKAKHIFSLSGVKMNSNNLNELPKGIYIVDGKKIKN